MLATTTARADCPNTLEKCDQAVSACKVALDARNEEIQLCRLGLVQSIDQSAGLYEELEKSKAQLQSPLRNPFIMTTVGIVLGIIVIGIAKK